MPLPKPVKISHLTAPREPLWKGPCAAGPAGGVTQSMLSAFVQCRERFRLRYVEGLRAAERFSARMEYGNMWHVCEEAVAKWGPQDRNPAWAGELGAYCNGLGQKYPIDREEINKWYGICRTQFPRYLDYWAKNDDVKNRTPLLAEQVFDVPYRLPSGRTVRLRGKWDSVDLVKSDCRRCSGKGTIERSAVGAGKFPKCPSCGGKGKTAGVWLMENKTKARIDENVLRRQLTFDLQVMTYLVALERNDWTNGRDVFNDPNFNVFKGVPPIKGVRYNVIRRTEHRQGKKETVADFCNRVGGLIDEAPGDWFMRWNVEVGPADLAAFRRKCLDPLLEQLCDWWEFASTGDPFRPSDLHDDRLPGDPPDPYGIHWQTPFGVGTWLLDGGSSDYDHYLESGSETGLRRTEELFTELQ